MNMPPRLVALDVSHEEISSLKEYAILNRFVNVVALEVSHNEIWPCLASAAVLLLSHSSTAADKEESLNELARLARLCRLNSTNGRMTRKQPWPEFGLLEVHSNLVLPSDKPGKFITAAESHTSKFCG